MKTLFIYSDSTQKYFWSKSKTHNEYSKMIEVLNASKEIDLDHFNAFPTTPKVDF